MKQLVLHVAVASLLVASVAKAEQKIGFVDMQKAIPSTSAGKKAKADLESEFEKKKKELQKKESDLKKMQEDLEKKKSVMSDEVLNKKQAEIQEEMTKYRDFYGKSQVDLQKRERDLTQPILEKMKKVIDRIAKEKSYTVILEASPMVLFADKSTDLTDEVIKEFEKEK